MAKMTVAKAKKSIIAKIRRVGGLYENCGQKELLALQDSEGFDPFDGSYLELSDWIEALDSESVKCYL